MELGCYQLVESCTGYAEGRISLQRRKRELKLFPATTYLEEVAMDLIGELPRPKRGNVYLLINVDRFSKLERAIL